MFFNWMDLDCNGYVDFEEWTRLCEALSKDALKVGLLKDYIYHID